MDQIVLSHILWGMLIPCIRCQRSNISAQSFFYGKESLHLEIVPNLRGSDKPKAAAPSQSFNLDHRGFYFDSVAGDLQRIQVMIHPPMPVQPWISGTSKLRDVFYHRRLPCGRISTLRVRRGKDVTWSAGRNLHFWKRHSCEIIVLSPSWFHSNGHVEKVFICQKEKTVVKEGQTDQGIQTCSQSSSSCKMHLADDQCGRQQETGFFTKMNYFFPDGENHKKRQMLNHMLYIYLSCFVWNCTFVHRTGLWPHSASRQIQPCHLLNGIHCRWWRSASSVSKLLNFVALRSANF